MDQRESSGVHPWALLRVAAPVYLPWSSLLMVKWPVSSDYLIVSNFGCLGVLQLRGITGHPILFQSEALRRQVLVTERLAYAICGPDRPRGQGDKGPLIATSERAMCTLLSFLPLGRATQYLITSRTLRLLCLMATMLDCHTAYLNKMHHQQCPMRSSSQTPTSAYSPPCTACGGPGTMDPSSSALVRL